MDDASAMVFCALRFGIAAVPLIIVYGRRVRREDVRRPPPHAVIPNHRCTRPLCPCQRAAAATIGARNRMGIPPLPLRNICHHL